MARRNAQDAYNAASIMWDVLRDPNREPQPAPKTKDPTAMIRRRGGVDTRLHRKPAPVRRAR